MDGQRAYELFVGKQPTVGAGLPRPPPIYRLRWLDDYGHTGR
jgi:hypothetical protein